MPIAVLAIRMRPNRASCRPPTSSMVTNSPPSRALNRVKILVFKMSATERLVCSLTTLISPRLRRSEASDLRKSVDRDLWALDILYGRRLGRRFRDIYLVNWLCVRQRGGGARRVFNNFRHYEGGREPEKRKRPAADYVCKPIRTEVYARNPGQEDHQDGA